MIIKYIFIYYLKADFNSEIEYLIGNLEKYIYDRKCDPNNNRNIQKMKKNQKFIGELNILKNNFIDDKKDKEENNISERSKILSRNINNNFERFYTRQNSPEKNKNLLNQKVSNSKLNQNNNNNWANRQNKPPIFKRDNNEENKQNYNSQTLQNFYPNKREEKPKIDKNINQKDVKIEGDNFKMLEKKNGRKL